MVRETHGSFADGMNYVMMAMYQGFSMTEKLIDWFDYNGKAQDLGIPRWEPDRQTEEEERLMRSKGEVIK